MKLLIQRFFAASKALAIAAMLAGSIVAGWLLQHQLGSAHAEAVSPTVKPASPSALKRVSSNRFVLPPEYVERVGIHCGEVKASHQPYQLPPLQGSLALDADKLVRIHSRFAGEVVSLGQTKVTTSRSPGEATRTETVPLRYLDPVRQGDLLAVVWSKELGEKKSELIEACSKLKTDEETLQRLQRLEQEGASSERSIRDAQRNVDSDRIAIKRIEPTLRSWRLTDEEIAAVREEAQLNKQPASNDKQQNWARVEIRAPQDGVILEKNCSVGDIVDTTFDLFKLGQMQQLKVWAHVYEEDLPVLESLQKPYPCEICLPAQPGVSCKGELHQIGAVIDPNQHTALVMGLVQNAGGKLRIGQFVTVKITIPAQNDELLIPSEAVVEDGNESMVFVKNTVNGNEYERRHIQVLRRTKDYIVIRRTAEGVQSGQQVVTRGALLLREALEEQRVEAKDEKPAVKS